MPISLHTIAAKPGSRTAAFRIGRGAGSGRGKTAGKGTKGQRARTGGRSALKLKGMKQMLLSFPKNRGFKSYKQKEAVLCVGDLSVLAPTSRVTLTLLRSEGLIGRADLSVKILSGGTLKKKLTIASGILISKGAKIEVERAGGTIE